MHVEGLVVDVLLVKKEGGSILTLTYVKPKAAVFLFQRSARVSENRLTKRFNMSVVNCEGNADYKHVFHKKLWSRAIPAK